MIFIILGLIAVSLILVFFHYRQSSQINKTQISSGLRKSILVSISSVAMVVISVYFLNFLSNYHKIIIQGIGQDWGLAGGAIAAVIITFFFLVNLALSYWVFRNSTKILAYLSLTLMVNILVMGVAFNYKLRPINFMFSDPSTEAQCQAFSLKVWGRSDGYGFDQSYVCNQFYWSKQNNGFIKP